MRQLRLKPLRVAGAVLIGGGLTLALLDFREAVPAWVGHTLASAQFVPAAVGVVAGVAGAVVVLVGLLLLTLLFGRVYCSVVCPLGIFQDVVARVRRWTQHRDRRRALPYARPLSAVRYGILGLTLLGVAGGAGGFTLMLADPYSNFGRLVAALVRPVVVAANNAIVGAGEALGQVVLYRVEPPWLAWPAVVGAVGAFALVGGLAWWRGRLFCNTVCPVGTVLGLIARRAAWQLRIRQEACVKCGDCLRACKAQCIDVRTGAIDAERCVACFNCIGVCEEHGIGHAFTWRRTAPGPDGRREFVVGAAVLATAQVLPETAVPAASPAPVDPNACGAVCPPGAQGLDRFLAYCTACHLCVSACPTHVLQPARLEYGFFGWQRPRLDFGRSFCNFDCTLCGEVCPTGAILPLALADKQRTRVGRAALKIDLCVVKRDGTECAACSEHCPTKAVETVPYRDSLRLPEVKPELCIGCGACEFACPVVPEKAITVSGRRRHEWADKAVEAKPVAPTPGAFPF